MRYTISVLDCILPVSAVSAFCAVALLWTRSVKYTYNFVVVIRFDASKHRSQVSPISKRVIFDLFQSMDSLTFVYNLIQFVLS